MASMYVTYMRLHYKLDEDWIILLLEKLRVILIRQAKIYHSKTLHNPCDI